MGELEEGAIQHVRCLGCGVSVALLWGFGEVYEDGTQRMRRRAVFKHLHGVSSDEAQVARHHVSLCRLDRRMLKGMGNAIRAELTRDPVALALLCTRLRDAPFSIP